MQLHKSADSININFAIMVDLTNKILAKGVLRDEDEFYAMKNFKLFFF